MTFKSPGNRLIAIIMDTTSGLIGGTEQNTLSFAQCLRKRGYQPLLVEVGKPVLEASSLAHDMSVICISCPHFGHLPKATWRDFLKKYRPQLIIRSKNWSGSTNLHMDFLVTLAQVPYLSWEHHTAFDPRPYWKKTLKAQVRARLLSWFHMRSVKRTLAVSHAVRDPLVAFFPVSPTSVDVIYPGVDFNYFAHKSIARKNLRADWGVPDSAFVIGSLGRLVAHKGNDFTLQLAADLMHKIPNLNLWCVIAGKGPDLERLENLAAELGIKERVCFPGWQESAPNTWSALDLFIMPSADEGLGMTLIEAIACGCLSVGATTGGMKEILTGTLTEYGLASLDKNLWCEKILSIAQATPQERSIKQTAAYDDVKRRFSADTQWNAMVDWMERYGRPTNNRAP